MIPNGIKCRAIITVLLFPLEIFRSTPPIPLLLFKMRSLSVICFTALAAAGSVFAQQTTATSTSSAAAATGTATGTTTSSTQGKVFQRFMQIWLENNVST
jgi:hypothetical protein